MKKSTLRLLFMALFSILLPGRLVALDLDPVLLGQWPPFGRGYARAVAIQNGYAFVALQYAGLAIIDVSDPANPQPVGGYDTSGSAEAVAVSGTHAYVAEDYAGLQVIDVSNPANPRRVGSYVTTGQARGVAVASNYAYVARGWAGLQVIDVSNPANPQRVGGYATSGSASGVALSGNHAYVTDGYDGLQVIDVSNPANPQRVGGCDTSGSALGVAVSGNYAYVMGESTGLQVIDVSNPANPQRVGGYDTSRVTWAVAVLGHYAYVAEAGAGLQVIDVSNPANPQRVGGYDTPGYALGVAVSDHYAYVADWGTDRGGLQVIDVSNPANPQRVGGYDTSRGSAMGVAVSGDYAYVADGYAGLQVINVSNPANPQRVGGYQTSGYAYGVAVSGNYAYVTVVYSFRGLEVIDISDPANPQPVGRYDTRGNAYDVAVSGRYAYLADYEAGLQVVDVSDPANPQRAGAYETNGALGVAMSGNYAYLADGFAGLQVIDVGNPTNPQRVGSYGTGGSPYGVAYSVAVSGNYAFLAGWREIWAGSDYDYIGFLQVIDVSNPIHPQRVGGYDTGRYPGINFYYGIAVSGNYVYVADAGAGLQVLDVSNPANPQRLGSNSALAAQDVVVANDMIFVAAGPQGLAILRMPELRIGGVSAQEGDSASTTAVFPVILFREHTEIVSVDFSTGDGSAHAGIDYIPTSGTLVFNPGETNKVINVQVIGDALDETNEHFFVNLSNLTNISLAVTQAVGMIIDDDTVPLSVSGVTVVEGHSGSVNADFLLTLARPLVETVSVAFATADGTARAPGDYVATNGVLTFYPGETNKTITVAVNGDTEDEWDETFLLRLSNAVYATLTSTLAWATIVNDDTVPLSINAVAVAEGDAGTVNADFLLTLERPHVHMVSVEFTTADGTARAPSDYLVTSGTLILNPGETSKTLTVRVSGDVLEEGDETFLLRLSNPVHATLVNTEAYATILDDDAVGLSISSVTVVEGDAGTVKADFLLTLAHALAHAVSVDFTTADGTGRAPGDYLATKGTLIFNPGETKKTLTIPVNGDALDESYETFSLLLSNPVHAILSTTEAQATILDDDAAAALDLDVVLRGSLPPLPRGPARAVAIQNGYAFVAVQEGGLQVINVSNPANLQPVGGYDTSGYAYGVAVSGNYAYVGDGPAGLQVIDVSDPANSQRVGGYYTGGYAQGVAVSGNYAYVADGSRWTGSNYVGSLEVIDVSNPANPQRVAGYDTSGYAYGVAVSGNYAFVANARIWTGSNFVGGGLHVIDISDPTNARRVGGYDTSGGAYSVVVSGNYAFVAVTTYSCHPQAGCWPVAGRLDIIDISDPGDPRRVGGHDTGLSAWRVAVSGNYAYVVDYYAGMQVIDVSNPANPRRAGGYDTSGEAWDVAVSGNYAYLAGPGIQVIDVSNPPNPQPVAYYDTSHASGGAVGVAVSGNYAYVADGGAGLQVIDVSNPANPQRLAGYDTGGYAQGVAVSRNYAYVADGPDGLQVIDVSDLANPRRVGGYDTAGYAWGVAVSGNYAYVADWGAGLQVIDVSDPANPQQVAGYDTSGEARAVAVSGNYAYLADGYSGLHVFDVSDPANPQRVGGYDSPDDAVGVAVSGNYAYVAGASVFWHECGGDSWGGSLEMIDISNPANPQRVGGYVTSWSPAGVVVAGNHAYVVGANWSWCSCCCGVGDGGDPRPSGGVDVIDIADPANPQHVGGHGGYAQGVAVSGNHAYVAAGQAGLQVIEVNPANPQRVGGYETIGEARAVAVSGNYLCVAESQRWTGSNYVAALHVINISDPSNPQWAGGHDTGDWAYGLPRSASFAYVPDPIEVWLVNDMTDPANPKRVGGYKTIASAFGVAVAGHYAFVADWYAGLHVVDVSNPANPQRVGGYETSGYAFGVAVSGQYAYVAESARWTGSNYVGGMEVIDVSDPANPQRVRAYDTRDWAYGLPRSASFAYVPDPVEVWLVNDMSDPANPQRVGGYKTIASAFGVAVAGSYAYLAGGYAGLQVIDVSNPANPRRVGGNTAFEARGVTVANGKVFVAAGYQGWFILELFQRPNSCPSAEDQTVFTPEDTPLAITLGADRDAEGEPALYALSQPPVYGALTLAANTAVYSPAPNYFGPDSFKFTVTDGHADCPPREYTVNITVSCVNDPPVATVSLALDECALRFAGRAEPCILSLNGSDAPVVLNGTATDLEPDCHEFGENPAYSWLAEDGAFLGNSPVLAGRFGLGCHTVALVVSDGTDRSAVLASFCVIAPGEAVEQCVALVDSSDIGTQKKRPLITTLKAAIASFDRGNYSSAAGQLRAFQNKVRAQIPAQHPEAARLFVAWIEDFLNATTCMAAVDSNPDQ